MPKWVTVKEGEVVATYKVGYWDYGLGHEPDQFDVSLSTGDESDEWFPTAEEAEDWARRRLAG